MKKMIAYIMVALVIAAIGVMGYVLYNGMVEEQEIRERIATLPPKLDLEYLYPNQQKTNSAGQPIIINYFSTTCQYCQAEIRDMQEHEELTNKARIILVSGEDSSVIQEFVQKFPVDTTRFEVARDYSRSILEFFEVEVVPATFVYGPDSVLTERFKGQVQADALFNLVE